MKIVVVSGGFDPLHSGHIEYFEEASRLGDKLFVALNSDQWLINKKGKYFLPLEERKRIISSLSIVDKVIEFEDDKLGSCINALEKIKRENLGDRIIFCNGGDRTKENIPEMKVDDCEFVFGVGGEDKKNSSSWILKDWSYDSEERVWGKFFNLFTESGLKVKELIVYPNKGMSFQRHFHRNEIWFISKGSCEVNFSKNKPDSYETISLQKGDTFFVPLKSWHQIINLTEDPCHIIEIQYGDKTIEDDIERLRFYEN